MASADAQAIERFSKLYYDGVDGASPPFSTLTWLGVPILKCPEDLQMYQEILFRSKPDIIIETGVAFGGSTLYLASLCDIMDQGEIVAVDVTLGHVSARTRSHPRVTLVEGSSADPDIGVYLEAAARGKRTMLILDSDHTAAHVMAELALLAPLVTEGCYCIVEDTNINGHPVAPGWGPGPYEAVDRFLSMSPLGASFQRDLWCERMLLSFNPGGYLRRIAA